MGLDYLSFSLEPYCDLFPTQAALNNNKYILTRIQIYTLSLKLETYFILANLFIVFESQINNKIDNLIIFQITCGIEAFNIQ